MREHGAPGPMVDGFGSSLVRRLRAARPPGRSLWRLQTSRPALELGCVSPVLGELARDAPVDFDRSAYGNRRVDEAARGIGEAAVEMALARMRSRSAFAESALCHSIAIEIMEAAMCTPDDTSVRVLVGAA